MARLFLLAGTLLGALAVMMGAFGAHALKHRLSQDLLKVFQTAVDYHVYHALALILTGILVKQFGPSPLFAWAGGAALVGIVLFSGSLYLLSMTGSRWLGVITPFGGTAFILGWILLAVAVWHAP